MNENEIPNQNEDEVVCELLLSQRVNDELPEEKINELLQRYAKEDYGIDEATLIAEDILAKYETDQGTVIFCVMEPEEDETVPTVLISFEGEIEFESDEE